MMSPRSTPLPALRYIEDDLAAYLMCASARPFKMGEMDCARFVAGWVEQMRGVNPGAGWTYDDLGAKEIIRCHGGLRKLGSRLAGNVPGLVETEASAATGDVAVVRLPNGQIVFAVCTAPGEWAVKTRSGCFIGPATPLRIWAIRGGGSVGPETIGFFILTSIGITGASAGVATVIGSIVITALSIGAQYALATLMAPKGKDPAQQQQTVKSTIAPRALHYGRVKTGGTLIFSHAHAGWWYNILVLGVGPLEIDELYLGEKLVTAPVQPGAAVGAYAGYVWLDTRTGVVPETSYIKVKQAFPLNWTDNHRLDGVASAMVAYVNPGAKSFSDIFQGGLPQFRAVVRGLPVFDPRTGLTAPSDNPALCILDYLTRREGYDRPMARIDLDSFATFADLCDEQVPLKNGLTENRYRLSGTIEATEPRKQALQRMLDTCDGKIYTIPGPGGHSRVAIRGGKYIPPEVLLPRSKMVAREWDLIDVDAMDRANVVKPVYTSPQHDFQPQEAGNWRDEARIAVEGEVPDSVDLKLVPSHAQAQRVAKIKAYRLNAIPRIKTRCQFSAIDTYEQAAIHIIDPALGIDAPFEVAKWSLEMTREGSSISIEAAHVPPEAWEWDAQTEEKPAPSVPATILDGGMPEVENPFTFVVPATSSSVQFRVEFDPPAVDNLTPEMRFRPTGADDNSAQIVSGLDGATVVTGGLVAASSAEYDLEVRVRSFSNGPWSAPETVPAVLASAVPDAISDSSATAGAGTVTLACTPGAETAAVRIYGNTANDFATATRLTTRPATADVALSVTVDDMPAGATFIFIEPVNASAIAGPHVTLTANIT